MLSPENLQAVALSQAIEHDFCDHLRMVLVHVVRRLSLDGEFDVGVFLFQKLDMAPRRVDAVQRRIPGQDDDLGLRCRGQYVMTALSARRRLSMSSHS